MINWHKVYQKAENYEKHKKRNQELEALLLVLMAYRRQLAAKEKT
ncbi:hypothetical protein UFOVP80_52 [uncultured Caudovirales phage]|jgi:hypothetical protein|uniref:Uncharacterized protein n=1 Tax=uncultured Caudovirales phage TaxID=2100421 RepID=A0A6J5L0C7_9CAUD|nr:hypothetical protein UFOVP80_52 [uncultured Caudovirales phage]